MDSDTSVEAENTETKNRSCPSSPASEIDEVRSAAYSDDESDNETKLEKGGGNSTDENENSDNSQDSSDDDSSSSGELSTAPVAADDDNKSVSSKSSESSRGNGSVKSGGSRASSPGNVSEKSDDFSGSSSEHNDDDDDGGEEDGDSETSSSDSEESTSSEKQLSEDGFRMLDKESELIKKEYMPGSSPRSRDDDNITPKDQTAAVSVAEERKSPLNSIADEAMRDDSYDARENTESSETVRGNDDDGKNDGSSGYIVTTRDEDKNSDDNKVLAEYFDEPSDNISETRSVISYESDSDKGSSLESVSKQSIRGSSPESICSVDSPLSDVSTPKNDAVADELIDTRSSVADFNNRHPSPVEHSVDNFDSKTARPANSPDSVASSSSSRNDFSDDDKISNAENKIDDRSNEIADDDDEEEDDSARCKTPEVETEDGTRAAEISREEIDDVNNVNNSPRSAAGSNASSRLSDHRSPVNNDKPSIDIQSPQSAPSFDELSDVSDIEIVEEHEEVKVSVTEENAKILDESKPTSVTENNLEDAVTLNVEKDDQFDFEAEDGECPSKIEDQNANKEAMEEETKKDEDSTEKKTKENEELEEGELTDDDEPKTETTEPRQICRFYNRGQCTWGNDCRFIHLGVTDKGNYSMFESVRSLPGIRQAPPPSMVYPVFQSTVPIAERLGTVTPAAALKIDEAPSETAWQRGLRQAKEMIRKSTKKKENEIDFEEKKMNITNSQEEIDRENDYYSRHSSPSRTPRSDNWKSDSEHKTHKPVDHYPADYIPHAETAPLSYYPPLHPGIPRADYWNPHRLSGLPYDEFAMRQVPYGPEYYGGRRYVHPNAYYARPSTMHPSTGPLPHSDYYDRKQKMKPFAGSSAREVIVQKTDKNYKDNSPTRYRGRRDGSSSRNERGGVRADEWSDPWMRSKSPFSSRDRRTKKTYSSKSSYSSSSGSSRSSSQSYSSNSRNSRSGSRSSASPSHSSRSVSRSRKRPPIQFKLSPSSRAQLPQAKRAAKPTSPVLCMEKRAIIEKQLPPLPESPKVKQRAFSPPALATNVVAPLPPSNVQAKPPTPPPLLTTKPVRNVNMKPITLPKAIVSNAIHKTDANKSISSSESSSGSSTSTESSSDDDSSESSDSESSSSQSSSSSVRRQKRVSVEDAARLQNLRQKSVDAMKLAGQKQQIRLTLKGSSNGALNQATKSGSSLSASSAHTDSRKDRQQPLSRKRPAASSESGSDSDDSDHKGSKRSATRREELLKQLKAVEDAIARKRSRMV